MEYRNTTKFHRRLQVEKKSSSGRPNSRERERKINIKMIWWPFIVFTCNILLSQFVFSVPVPNLPYWQLPQMPSGIQYIGNTPPMGGTPQSLLTANFAPNQIVTTNGMATNSFDSGFPAFFDFVGSAFGDLGRALGGGVSSAVGSQFNSLCSSN